ncbi:MAG: DUF2063 domain-containing protein [Betaproteobacteria bacterium]|nr:DUF2063 domain-containing protein [Betaproteobacteria bacterium]
MLWLRDLQEQFTQALFSGVDAPIENVIEAGSLDPSARLGIYRNNVLGNYRNALRDTYPVILRLVGDEFFNAAARLFAKQSFSDSGDLHDYGEEFGAFLAAFPPARGLPYLADVARLEWAVHRVFHAADAKPLDLSRLAEFSADRLPALRFTLSPAARLVESIYPIARIWHVSQPDYAGDDTVSLDEGTQLVLVSRRDHAIELRPLTTGEHAMLHALATGRPLGKALARALVVEPNFGVQKFMTDFVATSIFTDIIC